MNGLTIRPAAPADVDAVLEIWRRSEAIATPTDDPVHVSALVGRGDDQLLLAELDGEPVGTLIAAFDGWRANLYRMAVVPEARRRGIALALVGEAERRLREKGALRFHAGVRGDEKQATSFWEAAGFTHHPEMRRYTKQLKS